MGKTRSSAPGLNEPTSEVGEKMLVDAVIGERGLPVRSSVTIRLLVERDVVRGGNAPCWPSCGAEDSAASPTLRCSIESVWPSIC